MALNLTNKTTFSGEINAHKIALENGVVLFLGDLALGEFFSENLLFQNERERFARDANLAHSQKFRASRVLKFWALSEILGGNSQNGVNFGENLGANSNSANFGDEFGANSNLNLAKFKGDFAKNLALLKTRDELEKKWRKTRLHLCLSHSGSLVALACAPFKIGFDIEQIKPRNTAAVMDFCFNPHEKTRILSAENAVILDEFYRIFTAKEALIKLCDLTFADLARVGFAPCGEPFAPLSPAPLSPAPLSPFAPAKTPDNAPTQPRRAAVIHRTLRHASAHYLATCAFFADQQIRI